MYTDSSDSDTSERPPSHEPYEVTVARWRSRVAARSSLPSPPTLRQILSAPPGLPRRPAILVLPVQPILVGRPYRTQPNGVRKMLTARKSVGLLPSHRLALRYSESHSPSDHFSSDDFSSDTSLGSSSGYSSGHSISNSSFDSPATSFVGLSRKRCRSPGVSVPLATPVLGALSPVHADLLPPRKRIRDIDADIATAKVAATREAYARVEVDTRIDREDEDDEEAKSSHRGNGAVFIGRKTQRSLGAVPAVPDISGGRPEIENELLEEVKRLEWWFEQDIDDEGEEDEEDGGGDEV
ncbi:hypothetical protein Tco_1103008 [Tanacetum coccineum]